MAAATQEQLAELHRALTIGGARAASFGAAVLDEALKKGDTTSLRGFVGAALVSAGGLAMLGIAAMTAASAQARPAAPQAPPPPTPIPPDPT